MKPLTATAKASTKGAETLYFELHCTLIFTFCTLGSRGYFFLIDTDGWWRSRVNEAPRENNNHPSRDPYQTISTVYFVLGILRMDLCLG